MRYYKSYTTSSGSYVLTCLYVVLPVAYGIMVPTGKLTPIQPAEPSPNPLIVPSSFINKLPPAPVSEYNAENPEPAPLHPSYVPVRYDYIQYLKPTAIVYVPMRINNPAVWYNPAINEIENSSSDTTAQKYYELKKYNTKMPLKLLKKYENLPPHLQKKYIYYYINTQVKSSS